MFRIVSRISSRNPVVSKFLPRTTAKYERIRCFSTNTDPSKDPFSGRTREEQSQKRNTNKSKWKTAAGALGLSVLGFVAYNVINNDGKPSITSFDSVVTWLKESFRSAYNSIFRNVEEIFLPFSDKLLPDWGNPQVYGNIPPGTPAPLLLVVDLEKTLISSEYTQKFGWRHAKRPGVDRFLKELSSSYFEIVIVSENDIGSVMDILAHIDPEGRCHKFGQAHMELKGTTVIKRLDVMNRDLKRIILIDDDPNAAQLFPRNTLFVKPFENIHDTTDTVLYDLIPMLQAFVHEDVQDIPATLDKLGTHQAEEAVIEYQMRLSKIKENERRKRDKGLGGLIRGERRTLSEENPLVRSSIPSPVDLVEGGREMMARETIFNSNQQKNLVEFDPVTGKVRDQKKLSSKKSGRLFQLLEEQEKQKEEDLRRKMEQMNEIAARRQQEQHR